MKSAQRRVVALTADYVERFFGLPVKTPEQQALLMQHRVRDLLVRQRTQAINALRRAM